MYNMVVYEFHLITSTGLLRIHTMTISELAWLDSSIGSLTSAFSALAGTFQYTLLSLSPQNAKQSHEVNCPCEH